MRLDLVSWYKIFIDLDDSDKDLDTLEEISMNLNSLSDVADIDNFNRLQYTSDDTTMVHANKTVASARRLIRMLEPVCNEFLGISSDIRTKVRAELPTLLVSYSLLLYKQFGYESILDDYVVNRSIDTSRLNLPQMVMEDVAEDMSRVMDTMRLILVIFKTFNAYFAEYQVSTEEDLNDVIAAMEDAGLGTEAIVHLSEKEVQNILGGNVSNRSI